MSALSPQPCRVRFSRVALTASLVAVLVPSIVPADTVGGGTIASPAVGPAPANAVGGSGFALVKNWNFGTSASSTVTNMADMSANFQYHDQFGTIANSNYGAKIVSPDTTNALSGQPIEGVNTATPVRSFLTDSLRTYIVPLNGAATLSPAAMNTGSGSFQAKWTLPNGGSRLNQDMIWETRVRYVTPPYFWFALWTSGNKWSNGAEFDLIESFGYDNGSGYTNYDGQYWHSDVVGGTWTTNYSNWANGMQSRGVPAYGTPPPYVASMWHTWTWLYRKDNTYSAYVDGIEVQNGTLNWTLGATSTGEAINMSFLFDGTWGSRTVTNDNFPLAASALAGTYYEWDYSRVYLRTEPVKDTEDTSGITIVPGADGWFASTSVAGYNGANYIHDNNTNKGTKSVRFTPTLSGNGTYNVYMRWTGGAGRATNVPVDIVKADGTTATVTVDESVNGSQWNLLGTYNLAKVNVSATVRTTGTSGYVVADAMRFTPIANEIIVDNANCTKTGTWINSTSIAGYQGVNYIHDGNANKGAMTATFTPNLPVAGTYNVYSIWSADASRSNSVPYNITYSAGTVPVNKNQQANGGSWQLLGTYTFNAGTGGKVVVSNTGTTGYVIADAIRFVLVP